MTIATNTTTNYDVTGNREDLSDMVWTLDDFETPVLSAIKKTKASSVTHEYQTDAIGAAADNAHLEGDDNTDGTDLVATTRLANTCQIMKYKPIVSGTQEKGMDHAGVRSEMAYQEAKYMKKIKKDMERAILDGGAGSAVGNAKVAGNTTTAREMASLNTYLTTNVSVGGTGAAASGDGTGVMTTGTDRDLTEALLTAVLATTWTAGGDPSMLVVSATNKGVVSDFAGGSTRYVDTNTKELVHSIDVYVGDFHTLKVCPCRQLVGDNAYSIDPEYLALAELDRLHSYDLAKSGDNFKREMVWEATLEVCNEAAHGIVADTNG